MSEFLDSLEVDGHRLRLSADATVGGTNSGDQDLSAYLTSATAASTYLTAADLSGYVTGASLTDNAIVRGNGGAGDIQTSSATIDDTGLLTVSISTAATASITAGMVITCNSTGTPDAGFGTTLVFQLKTSSTNDTSAGYIESSWSVATHAIRRGRMHFHVYDASAARECLALGTSGTAARIGFLGASAAVAQTGDAGTALVTFGLMSGTPTFAAANLTGTLAAGQFPALTGDVTTTAGSVATAIGANKVTLGMLAQVATARFLGRTTAGTGDVESLTGTQATALLDAFTAAGGSAAKGLAPAPGATTHSNRPFYLGDDGSWHARTGELIAASFVTTSESTTSATAVDLTTTQHLTFTLDETSDRFIQVSSTHSNSGANVNRLVVDVDGSDTTLAATAVTAASTNNVMAHSMTSTGLASGSHTIKLQFSTSAGTASFFNRTITVWRLA